MKDYLFAYGTLAGAKPPPEVARAVRRLKYVGEGSITGQLYDLGDYPGAVLQNEPNGKVFGKIFELPDDRGILSQLDAYEGFDSARPDKSLFVRKRTSISRPNQPRVEGWVYEFNGDVRARPHIRSGCYSKASA